MSTTEKTSNGNPVIRARFTVTDEDYRPMTWPIDHPYWCSGSSEEGAILIAYVESEAQLLQLWPDAIKIDMEGDFVDSYEFTDRFRKPEWFAAQQAAKLGSK